MMVENDLHEAEKEYTLLRDGLIKPTWENQQTFNASFIESIINWF